MNRIQEIYRITLQLEGVLNQYITVNNREQVIEQMNALVEARGKYLDDLTPPYTEDEKMLGEKIILLNGKIEEKMHHLFNDLKTEMKQMKKQKQSNRTYTNPYAHLQTMDGMFLDSKK